MPIRPTGITGRAGGEGQPADAGAAAVQDAVPGAGAFGVDADALAASRMSSSVFSAWTLAACSPRSTGMEPTASKKDFMTLPLTPPVVKYSAFAKKATGRGMSAWTITLSRKERWLGATMNGPVLGHVFQADDGGPAGAGDRARAWSSGPPSNIAIGAHLAQGCGRGASSRSMVA